MKSNPPPQGAEIIDGGVRYSIWAPTRDTIVVEIYSDGGDHLRSVPLRKDHQGFFTGVDHLGRAGDLYKLRPDGLLDLPSPASRFQPYGVHGCSEVIDASAYRWEDRDWIRPPFRDLIIYELHIGTFTAEGTFRSAIARLPHLANLGINAIELMPVADFPGDRGWGYDGVSAFAPARCYGRPDDLRALIDAAHQHGIAVILDVVYNHFGPDGNFTAHFSPLYFTSAHRTPWGDAINFGGTGSDAVRSFFRDNLLYWIEDFHVDGFRLDATHECFDESKPHILEELAALAHARGRYIVAEDERNEARIITPANADGFGFDGMWADDFHHSVEVAVVAASRYREDFLGELHELIRALRDGWVYQGQESRRTGEARGTACGHLPPERFIFCVTNHDQIGNRAFGERLNHLVSPAVYRAASALLLLNPYTPLLFQGQEWAASTPFLYFTDHNPELGRAVEAGRRKECRFEIFAKGAADIPSPQSIETFRASKLIWDELTEEVHRETLELYRELIRIRRTHAEFRPVERASFEFHELPAGVLAMTCTGSEVSWLLLCDLRGGHRGTIASESSTPQREVLRWVVALSTNESRFGGTGADSEYDPDTGEFHFSQPGVLVLRALK